MDRSMNLFMTEIMCDICMGGWGRSLVDGFYISIELTNPNGDILSNSSKEKKPGKNLTEFTRTREVAEVPTAVK